MTLKSVLKCGQTFVFAVWQRLYFFLLCWRTSEWKFYFLILCQMTCVSVEATVNRVKADQTKRYRLKTSGDTFFNKIRVMWCTHKCVKTTAGCQQFKDDCVSLIVKYNHLLNIVLAVSCCCFCSIVPPLNYIIWVPSKSLKLMLMLSKAAHNCYQRHPDWY